MGESLAFTATNGYLETEETIQVLFAVVPTVVVTFLLVLPKTEYCYYGDIRFFDAFCLRRVYIYLKVTRLSLNSTHSAELLSDIINDERQKWA